MIHQPSEIKDGEKRIRMLIAGPPGIGKSTLALSAPKPLHVDTDFGVDRIEPQHRKPYIQPQDYNEIIGDLTEENTKDFETIVFDTGGKLISLMQMYAIRKEPKYSKRDGSLSQAGYGLVGREFVRLMDHCFYKLKKNIVVVFHSIEEKHGEDIKLRIKVEGQTKNNVWEPMDLGGFVEMQSGKRTIGFDNNERYFAKGTRGVHGVRVIPPLREGMPNDFLTRLFAEYNKKTAAETKAAAVKMSAYDAVMEEGRAILRACQNNHEPDDINEACRQLKSLNHVLSSRTELSQELNVMAKSFGLKLDKESKLYVQGDPLPAE